VTLENKNRVAKTARSFEEVSYDHAMIMVANHSTGHNRRIQSVVLNALEVELREVRLARGEWAVWHLLMIV